jgi:hypothetical protein
MDITLKVAGTLRQRYAKCKAASKVFRRPLPKIALYGYGMSTTSKVMYSVRGFFGSGKGHRECDSPDRFNSFPAKVIEGPQWFSELLSVKTYFIEGC